MKNMVGLVAEVVSIVGVLGYLGIFLLMTLESTFFPFPSEVVIIPAGYLAYLGQMNIFLIWICGTLGSLFGALFNYYLAYFLGRPFIDKYGKYFFINKKNMEKADLFFEKHGGATTFFGRLIPGVRQYISLPAGLTKMNVFKFSIYTTIGAGIWVAFLIALGYIIGVNYALVQQNILYITLGIIFIILLYILFLYLKSRKRCNDEKN